MEGVEVENLATRIIKLVRKQKVGDARAKGHYKNYGSIVLLHTKIVIDSL